MGDGLESYRSDTNQQVKGGGEGRKEEEKGGRKEKGREEGEDWGWNGRVTPTGRSKEEKGGRREEEKGRRW